MMKRRSLFLAVLTMSFAASHAAVLTYGDQDLLGTGVYGSDPTAGATLQGLAPGMVTYATLITAHAYPFAPSIGDYPGTDQIFVGATQTGAHDGYSVATQRINGPQVITLDYSALIPSGSQINTFTLGIAADDFQFPPFGQPFTASINGVVNAALSSALNSVDQSGPVTQFLTIGLDPTTLASNNILTLTINEGGDAGDGWAVDYLTAGVTTSLVPEPSPSLLLAVGALALTCYRHKFGKHGSHR
jgi:hypothetical protein